MSGGDVTKYQWYSLLTLTGQHPDISLPIMIAGLQSIRPACWQSTSQVLPLNTVSCMTRSSPKKNTHTHTDTQTHTHTHTHRHTDTHTHTHTKDVHHQALQYVCDCGGRGGAGPDPILAKSIAKKVLWLRMP